MRIFLIVLALCYWSVAATVVDSSSVVQPVTINAAYVSETSTHFLLQSKIPRTGIVAENCDSAKHIAFVQASDSTRRPRWVVFTTDTVYLYADVAKNTGVNTSYIVCFNKTFNEVNASATFTNCGITNFWGIDESSGAIVSDYASGVNGTVNSPATIGNSGLFGNSAEFTASTTGGIIASKTLTYSAGLYIETIIYPVFTGNGVHIIAGDWTSSGIGGSLCYNNYGLLLFFTSATGSPSSNVTIQNSTWAMAGMWFDALSTNPVFTYNGALDKRIAQAPITGTTSFAIGNRISPSTTYSGSGKIDHVAIYTSGVSSDMIADRYRALFTSTFWTLGAPVPVTTPPDTITLTCTASGYDSLRWFLNGIPTDSTGLTYTILADSAFYAVEQVYYVIAYNVGGATKSGEWVFNAPDDTIILTCTASGYDSLRWFHNGVATDSTGTTYTIYADSAFYAVKHVIYCMAYNVGGSTKSGEWVFNGGIVNRSRWGSFLRPFKDAYKSAFK